MLKKYAIFSLVIKSFLIKKRVFQITFILKQHRFLLRVTNAYKVDVSLLSSFAFDKVLLSKLALLGTVSNISAHPFCSLTFRYESKIFEGLLVSNLRN